MADDFIKRSELIRQLKNSKEDTQYLQDKINPDKCHRTFYDICLDIAENVSAAEVVEVKHGE